MFANLKPVSEQVIVITGASSGIRLSSRNGLQLKRIVDQIRADGSHSRDSPCGRARQAHYFVGGGSKLLSSINKRIPGAIDWMASGMAALQSSGPPNRPREGSLNAAAIDGQVCGNPITPVHGSLYTRARLHPVATIALATLVGVAALAISSGAKRS